MLEKLLFDYVDRHREALYGHIADLVRCPSENTPPTGNEGPCQQYLFEALRRKGYAPELYEVLYSRPNLMARREGSGGGRSLIVSGHIDTVPRGTQRWTRDPFSGHMEAGRLYGRGSVDMKAGVATNLLVAQALADLDIRLRGAFTFESVIDEEFGGVTGTRAARLRGITADAAIISEPSGLRICPAQRGGRTVHITFRDRANAVEPLSRFLAALPDFAALRRRTTAIHSLYSHCADPVPVSVTKISTGPWGTSEPITVPVECRVELFWQLMPGEVQAAVDAQFQSWFRGLFGGESQVEHAVQWLPGSAMDPAAPLVQELSASAARLLPAAPLVEGIEGPCDLFVFHEYGIPAVLWGASGANLHNADEYVELESVVSAAKALLLFVCNWCGVERVGGAS